MFWGYLAVKVVSNICDQLRHQLGLILLIELSPEITDLHFWHTHRDPLRNQGMEADPFFRHSTFKVSLAVGQMTHILEGLLCLR